MITRYLNILLGFLIVGLMGLTFVRLPEAYRLRGAIAEMRAKYGAGLIEDKSKFYVRLIESDIGRLTWRIYVPSRSVMTPMFCKMYVGERVVSATPIFGRSGDFTVTLEALTRVYPNSHYMWLTGSEFCLFGFVLSGLQSGPDPMLSGSVRRGGTILLSDMDFREAQLAGGKGAEFYSSDEVIELMSFTPSEKVLSQVALRYGKDVSRELSQPIRVRFGFTDVSEPMDWR